MKRLFLSILLCVFVWGMKAQEMDAVFVAMPDQYVPQLENAWRKDLIDLYNSGKEAKLKNTMNGFSTLKKLTDDYLLLQVTERSTVEMKLLPLVNDTYVVCMITTVYGPVPDSQVEFFTTDWKKTATFLCRHTSTEKMRRWTGRCIRRFTAEKTARWPLLRQDSTLRKSCCRECGKRGFGRPM